MYRNKTVETMQRSWDKERAIYLTQISELLDRLMHITGKPWTIPPVDMPVGQPRETVEAYVDYGPEYNNG